MPSCATLPDAGHRVKLYFRQQPDAEGVSRRGKPDGVKFCEFAFNYDTIPPSPDACQEKSLIRRSPEVTEFTQNEAGRKVYYFARWINVNGQPGPWTDMNQFMVP